MFQPSKGLSGGLWCARSVLTRPQPVGQWERTMKGFMLDSSCQAKPCHAPALPAPRSSSTCLHSPQPSSFPSPVPRGVFRFSQTSSFGSCYGADGTSKCGKAHSSLPCLCATYRLKQTSCEFLLAVCKCEYCFTTYIRVFIFSLYHLQETSVV